MAFYVGFDLLGRIRDACCHGRRIWREVERSGRGRANIALFARNAQDFATTLLLRRSIGAQYAANLIQFSPLRIRSLWQTKATCVSRVGTRFL